MHRDTIGQWHDLESIALLNISDVRLYGQSAEVRPIFNPPLLHSDAKLQNSICQMKSCCDTRATAIAYTASIRIGRPARSHSSVCVSSKTPVMRPWLQLRVYLQRQVVSPVPR